MPATGERLAKLSQTEIDHQELDSTVITPATARLFSWAFVVLLFSVPLSQFAVDILQHRTPPALQLFQPVLAGVRHATAGRWSRAASAGRDAIRPETLHGYEAALESASLHKSYFQPRVQEVLTGRLGAGNEKVVRGQGDWLFFEQGLQYVVHQSVIDPATLDLTARTMVNKGIESSPHPDPRPAFLQFDLQCRQAGIHLIVLPAPDKVMLQPSQLSRQSGTLSVPNNEGYARLVREMRAAGIDWLDVAPSTVDSTAVRYLRQDTHWTPQFMDTVAQAVATHIRQTGVLPDVPPVPMRLRPEPASRLGDLVDMLKLTPRQRIFAPQSVTVSRVIDVRTGETVKPDYTAPVLLLGDSFANIYSLREMGWGSGAGFVEHLAYHLHQPIDVISFNGGGASRTRLELARQDNAVRLGAKKVIIYEFAIRDLLGENWAPVSMASPVRPPAPSPGLANSASSATPAPDAAQKKPVAAAPAAPGPLAIRAVIVQTSRVPEPGTSPYKDCLTLIKVKVETVISGQYAKSEMLVALLAMRDDKWLPAARYAAGDRLQLTLIPLEQADSEIRTLQRADDTEDYSLRPFYALAVRELPR